MNINNVFPSKYLKAPDLEGRAVLVTIVDVKLEQVGQSKDVKPVAYFQDKRKGLVLNKTNAARIATLAGSGETDDWTGVQVQLYATETEYQGETIDCIRVRALPATRRATPPPAPVVPEPDIQVDADDIPF